MRSTTKISLQTGFLAGLLMAGASTLGGEVSSMTNPDTNAEVYQLRQGSTVVKVAPFAGANAYSIQVDGVEYLRQPESMDKLPGAGYGNPVLYPTPNRVKDATFQFRGKFRV